MTAPATDSIEETLRDALRIRHSVADLERFSGALALLALNAKISAAKLGLRGRPFKALTHEITKTSFNLNAIVGHMINDLNTNTTNLEFTTSGMDLRPAQVKVLISNVQNNSSLKGLTMCRKKLTDV